METDDTFIPEENSENSDGVENSQESPNTEVLTDEELSALIKKDDREEINRIITTAEGAIRWKRCFNIPRSAAMTVPPPRRHGHGKMNL